jgi:hypothetical protein
MAKQAMSSEPALKYKHPATPKTNAELLNDVQDFARCG